ncbi:MAG: hypothetical protein ABI761_01115 [Saprospiraceae bacterium]
MNLKLTRIPFVVIGLIFVLNAYTQSDVVRGNNIADHLLIKQREALTNPPDIDGSPYDKDSFALGNVYTMKGIFKDISMRQDLVNDWIEFREKGVRYILDPGPNIIKVELDTITLYTQPVYKDGKLAMGFFKVLDDDKVKLLVQKSILFVEKPPVKAYTSTNIPAKFVRDADKYYFRVDNLEAKRISNIKKMIDLFPDHHKELTSYIKRKKVGINQDDLLKLWAYYNKL